MSDWYVSSVDYNALPVWATSTAYTIGQIIRPLTPNGNSLAPQRCTTAGTTTTEPTWSTANNATSTSGTAVFTNIAGQSAYGWSGAAGSLYTVSNAYTKSVSGDRIFVGSDHSESYTGFLGIGFGSANFGTQVLLLSVNRAGSVPPVVADLLAGATIHRTDTNPLTLDAYCPLYWYGFTLSHDGTAGDIRLNSSGNKTQYFKNCTFKFTNASNSTGKVLTAITARVIWDNTTIQFSNVGLAIGGTNSGTQFDFIWINTPSAIQGATIPTTLFTATLGGWTMQATLRGVDLSALNTTLITPASTGGFYKILLDSCRIASGLTRLGFPGGVADCDLNEVELVNCYDGTNILNERYSEAGAITTDRSMTLSGGAQDDVGTYSLKLASNTRSDKQVSALNCFVFDVENAVVGVSKTATIEIVSAGTLNTDDIRLLLEYMGTAGNPVASFIDTLATVLTVGSALPTSSNTWTGSIPTTWNPLDASGGITLSNNNLTATQASGANGVRANIALGSGKYYFEITPTALGGGTNEYGIASASAALTSANTAQYAVVSNSGTNVYTNGTFRVSLAGTPAVGTAFGIAVDVPNQLIWFRIGANAWNAGGTANPATGVGGYSFSSLTGAPYPIYAPGFGADGATANFGATAFANAAPSGFSAPVISLVKQLLQTSFTPQRAGRVRGLVRLGKLSTTVWVNPQITIT
jgi:hypothetical protein